MTILGSGLARAAYSAQIGYNEVILIIYLSIYLFIQIGSITGSASCITLSSVISQQGSIKPSRLSSNTPAWPLIPLILQHCEVLHFILSIFVCCYHH